MVGQGPVPLLHDYLLQAAERSPDKVALVADDRRLTFRDLDGVSNALAHALTASGVGRGDRVVIFGDNVPETALGFWAALKANAVAVLVNAQTKSDKLAYLLADCRPRALLSGAQWESVFAGPAAACPHLARVVVWGSARELAGLPGAVAWDEAVASGAGGAPPPRLTIDVDLASIIYTSGSTGEPKGVMLTHRNMLTAAVSISSYLQMQADDVVLGMLPLSFDYGLYQMIMCFRLGARLVLERSFAFPARLMSLVAKEGVTGFPGVPTVYATLGELKDLRERTFPRVRFVTNTAAALPAKHIELLRRMFPAARLYSMYGLTECKRVSYLPPADLDRKPGSVGLPIPNTEVWIVDEEGRRLPPNQVGQLVVRGATVMRGYWEKPEETARKLRPGPLPGETVLYTGDYCRLDEDGYLYFVGRMDDVIKSRGEKVAPKEVENALMGIPGVKEAAVIGVPDEVLGHAVKAFVVLEAGVTLDERELQKACALRLESYKVPRFIQVVPDLPKSANGKIQKSALS